MAIDSALKPLLPCHFIISNTSLVLSIVKTFKNDFQGLNLDQSHSFLDFNHRNKFSNFEQLEILGQKRKVSLPIVMHLSPTMQHIILSI